MTVIAAVQRKGGVGKSTITCHLLWYLKNQGHEVALVDADPQRVSTYWAHEACSGIEVVEAVTADEILERIPGLAQEKDYVLCDGPAGSGEASRSLLLRADVAILPCTASTWDMMALADTARILHQARSIRNGAPKALVVLNRFISQTLVSREIRESVPSIGLDVARNVLKQRTAIADSAGQGRPVFEMGPGAKEAAEEMRLLIEEVLEYGRQKTFRREPVQDTEADGSGEGLY